MNKWLERYAYIGIIFFMIGVIAFAISLISHFLLVEIFSIESEIPLYGAFIGFALIVIFSFSFLFIR